MNNVRLPYENQPVKNPLNLGAIIVQTSPRFPYTADFGEFSVQTRFPAKNTAERTHVPRMWGLARVIANKGRRHGPL